MHTIMYLFHNEDLIFYNHISNKYYFENKNVPDKNSCFIFHSLKKVRAYVK
jgi:hypothetical protein